MWRDDARPCDPRHRDVVRRDRCGARHRATARSSPTSSPPRPSCTRASAASCPRSRAVAISSSSSPVVSSALAEAGAELSDVEAVAVTTRPGLIGALLVGVSAAKALAWARRLPLVPVEPSARPRRLALPAAARSAAAVHLPARERRPHDAARRDTTAAATACSARRSTTPPARRSTRARGCSGSAIRAGRRSTPLAKAGRPVRLSTSRSRASPGLDFSFSGAQDRAPLRGARPRAGRARGATRRSRRRVPARDRDARSSSGFEATGADADRRRGRRRRELRAAGGAAGCRARAASALHRQRGDDRVGRPLHTDPSPTPTTFRSMRRPSA